MTRVFRLAGEVQLAALQKRMGMGKAHRMEGSRPELQARPGKYGNRRFKDEFGWWDSKKERQRWGELLLLQKAGEIQGLTRQVDFELIPPQMLCGRRLRPIVFRADFTYTQDGKPIVEDAKGFRNRLYLLKKRLMWSVHKIEIYET